MPGDLLNAEELRWIAEKQEQVAVPLSLLAIHELVKARRAMATAKETDLLNKEVSSMLLSTRARNGLKKINVVTIGDLIKLEEAELTTYKHFGNTVIREIKTELAKLGLVLKSPGTLSGVRRS